MENLLVGAALAVSFGIPIAIVVSDFIADSKFLRFQRKLARRRAIRHEQEDRQEVQDALSDLIELHAGFTVQADDAAPHTSPSP